MLEVSGLLSEKYCPNTLICYVVSKGLRTDESDRVNFVQFDMGQAMADVIELKIS